MSKSPTDELEHDAMGEVDQEKVLGSIIRNGKAIVIRLRTFKGSKYVDIRNFFKNKKNNKFFPTTKGIAFGIQDLSELITFLEKVEAEVSQDLQTIEAEGISL